MYVSLIFTAIFVGYSNGIGPVISYDDGHRDVFFCLSVNLLEIEGLKGILEEAERGHDDAQAVVGRLYRCAEARGIPLELRR